MESKGACHERQRLQFYLLHTLNNLLQEKESFSRAELDAIAGKLVHDDPNKSRWTPLSAIFKPHHNILIGNYDLHAFVEYDTVEDAEKAVFELNDERNWRSGLRLRLLNKCMAKQGAGRGRKAAHEGDGTGEEEAMLATNQPNEKQPEDPSQPSEASFELVAEDALNEREGGGGKRNWGRGRGRGRGRGQYHNNNNHHRGGVGHGHAIGTPPASHPIHNEQPAAPKQPPGPRMPDGTRGFTMGRGKTVAAPVTAG